MENLIHTAEMRDVPSVGPDGAGHELPGVIDAADFLAQKIKSPPELVARILHQGSKFALGGASKSNKTWVLIDLALSVATGTRWLDFETTKGRVLFCNLEIQEPFFQDRIKFVSEAKHISLSPGIMDVLNLRGHAGDHRSLIPRIIERAKDKQYVMVILDPIYKLYGNLDENSASDVAGLLNALECLARETGAAVAFAAHYSKGNQANKESIDRVSGSGVFARDPDAILNFTAHDAPDAFTVEATLRNYPPLPPFVVRWSYPLMKRDDSLNPADLKKRAGRKPKHTVDDILDALKGHQLTTSAWQQRAASPEFGIPKSPFYQLLKDAKQKPELKKTPDGQWYYDAHPDQQS